MKVNGINEMRMVDSGPEKAGVGGSSPSLATILPTTTQRLYGFYAGSTARLYGSALRY
jgi:hypothetical protein